MPTWVVPLDRLLYSVFDLIMFQHMMNLKHTKSCSPWHILPRCRFPLDSYPHLADQSTEIKIIHLKLPTALILAVGNVSHLI